MTREAFEQIVASALSKEDLAEKLRTECLQNPFGDRFIILTDGPQSAANNRARFTTNVSVDSALELATDSHSDAIKKIGDNNPNIAMLEHVTWNALLHSIVRDVPRIVESSFVSTLTRYRDARERCIKEIGGNAAPFGEAEALLWEILNEALPLAEKCGEDVFDLYTEGKLEKLMHGTSLIELYNQLPSEPKKQLRDLIVTISDPLEYQ